MTSRLDALDAVIDSRRSAALDELFALLRLPSVSTLPEHRGDCERAVQLLMSKFTAMGLEHVQRLMVREHGLPLVYADWLHAAGAPTVLFYGHYDVQPPDPLAEWISPPFTPTLRDGNIYARGAADDKGQVFAQIEAVQAWMQAEHALPVNVRFLIEGEEEVGGESVEAYIRAHHAELACDCVVVSDTAMYAPGLPSLDVGLRGMVYTEVEVQGAARDLHSGLYGGAAPNPLEALARIITGLKSGEGKILIPGFYDRVAPPAVKEKEAWRRLPFDEEAFRRDEVRSPALTGEAGFSVFERTWARPTLEVHGIPGGFTGAGAKTVIPARAAAKISMRLVPDQDPEEIAAQFTAAVQRLSPAGCTSQVRILSTAPAVLVSPDNRYVGAAVASLRRVFGAEPVFIRSGGSIPVVALCAAELEAPVVMMGFGLPDDGLHSPNEKFALSSFYGGIRALADFMLRLTERA